MPDYPAYICEDCGRKWGRRSPSDATTWHEGVCDLCGEERPVSEPRDFGYLREGWQEAVRRNE